MTRNGPLAVRRSFGALVVSCIGLVALSDWLFYERPIGWSAGLFLAALLGVLLLRGGRGFREVAGWVLTAAVAGLVVALVEHPSLLAVTCAALTAVSLAAVARAGWPGG